MTVVTTKEILRIIGCDHLNLQREEGRWDFIYDNPQTGIRKVESVYTFHLRNGTLDFWVEIGQEFVNKIEERKVSYRNQRK